MFLKGRIGEKVSGGDGEGFVVFFVEVTLVNTKRN